MSSRDVETRYARNASSDSLGLCMCEPMYMMDWMSEFV